MKFNVYSDPQHGWCKVKRSLLVQLCIDNDISSFSYERGEYVYIEEDGDMAIFITAMNNKNIKFSFNELSGNRSSRIRNYNRYTAKI